MRDCRWCQRSAESALGMGQLTCSLGPVPVPTNWQRSPKGECGVTGQHFVQRHVGENLGRRKGDRHDGD